MIHWLLLGGAIGSEVTATLALKASDGFTRLVPAGVVVAGYALSFWLLSIVVRELPIGVVYAIWSGIGTIAVGLLGAVLFGEPLSALKLAAIVVIVAGVALLELAPS